MKHVEWQEVRNGELFFVAAEKTANAWQFLDRSTYEVRWFTAQPKEGWVERAEYLLRMSASIDEGFDASTNRKRDSNYCSDSQSALRQSRSHIRPDPLQQTAPPPEASARVARFKSHLVDAAVVVTALSWTHGLLVHDVMMLPVVAESPVWANVIAGSLLATALHFVSRKL